MLLWHPSMREFMMSLPKGVNLECMCEIPLHVLPKQIQLIHSFHFDDQTGSSRNDCRRA